MLCRPGLALPANRAYRYLLLGALAAAALLLIFYTRLPFELEEKQFQTMLAVLLVVGVLCWNAPLPLAAIVAFVLLANHVYYEHTATTVRSFFGVHKLSETAGGRFRLLTHGTTMHGAQRLLDDDGQPVEGRPEPLLYYYDRSAIAQAIDAVRGRVGGPIRYAVIGLGSGSLACRAAPEDRVHYYEIDPAIIRIARDPNLFTFLSSCGENVEITLGDARLTLAEAPSSSYDLIIVDAFSSDAIPMHLLTREAMAIYVDKLAPHGMVVMHVSNRHLELASVVAGIAAANGLITRVHDAYDLDETVNPYKYSGTVAASVRREEDFNSLAETSEWQLQEPDPSQWIWTDDYSNIVGSVLRKLKE